MTAESSSSTSIPTSVARSRIASPTFELVATKTFPPLSINSAIPCTLTLPPNSAKLRMKLVPGVD